MADAVEDLAEYKEEVPKLHRFHRGFRDDVFATIADLKAQLATRPTREQVAALPTLTICSTDGEKAKTVLLRDVFALFDKDES